MEEKITKFLWVIIVGLLIVIFVGCYSFYQINIVGNINFEVIDKSNENLGITESPKTSNKPTKPSNEGKPLLPESEKEELDIEKENDEVIRVVLLGIDSRGNNDRGRSDAIMVVTLDTSEKKIKLASFLRDLQVDINGKPDKLNHSYSYDKGVGVLRALNSNFGLDLTDYVTVNMFNLRQVIDKIGGITVDIKKNEISEINYRIKEIAKLEGRSDYTLLTEIGVQELNGEQAVAYMRIRNTGRGDFDRTGRQREVIELLVKEIAQKNIVEVMSIASEVSKLIGTTLEQKELESLVLKVLPILKEITIEGRVFPESEQAYSDMSTGIYYLKLRDKEKFTVEVQEYLCY